MPGDGRLAAYTYNFDSQVNLTVWDELRQWDLKPNPDRVFEAGRPIWTFHHFTFAGWIRRDMIKIAAVSATASEQSILRRSKFDSEGLTVNGRRNTTF